MVHKIIQHFSHVQIFKNFAAVANGSYIYYWQSKGLYDARIGSITVSNCSVTPNLNYYGNKTRVGFYGNYLKQDKIISNHEKVVNILVVYEIIRVVNISKYSSNDNYPTLENALFGAVNLTKNADFNKCKYCKYGIGFDRKSSFSHPPVKRWLKCNNSYSRYEFINKD